MVECQWRSPPARNSKAVCKKVNQSTVNPGTAKLLSPGRLATAVVSESV
jgi:hypothetical protein